MEKDTEKNSYTSLSKERRDCFEKARDFAVKAAQENDRLREELYMTYTSSSWRLTAPLRALGDICRDLKKLFRILTQKLFRPLFLLFPKSIKNAGLVRKLKDHYNRILWKS